MEKGGLFSGVSGTMNLEVAEVYGLPRGERLGGGFLWGVMGFSRGGC